LPRAIQHLLTFQLQHLLEQLLTQQAVQQVQLLAILVQLA
jgi:hypothetical protein